MWLLLKSAMRGGRLSKDSKLSIKTQIGDGTGFWLLAGGGTAVAICGFLLSSWCCLKTPCRSSGCNITFSTKVSRGEPINTVDGEDDGEEEEGAACGEIGGTGGRSTAKPSKPIKAFIELSGDVHTIPLRLAGIDSIQELRLALAEACLASGAPELRKGIDIQQADIQYLDASNTPAMVSEMTNPVAIRGARAVRVIFPLSSEEI